MNVLSHVFTCKQEAHGPHRSPEKTLEKKIFKSFVNVFPLFRNYLPLEKDRIQGCFVPSLVEIITMVLEKQILNFVNVFLLLHNYLPLEKGRALYLNKLESPKPKNALCQVWGEGALFEQTWIPFFSQGCFVPSLVENSLVALEKKII